ncbi:UDP-2,3-diacylglucosamine diphosphatase [Noviherbaspirillum sp. CPCC 100848]|uniref:UDP-2,3-diacylglucosamine hydrolase n=1 Tax=Noviherbaspirillum album TaxID=3080276 RepID=A0ABU6JD83_9BURK|nr:UDP-2,3-diacylglucosamine diphosphatase [Noviherbaspirillum sp. CPCC 100848]MEC4721413.1 UDP-2,3-diacylglucosamine diphosphatase [Noviherbaspirillum sp. CPCC 100848]
MTPSAKAQSAPVALFVSDVHLQPELPCTTDAFLLFLRREAPRARQLFLLGDLFEYWAGDDDLETPYLRRIADALRAVSDAGVRLYWIAGNRDFLVGQGFAEATGAQLLQEPYVTEIANHPVVLLHGDAQCTDDLGYMQFRAMVRQPEWQRQFLAMPLAQRKAVIEGMRAGSRDAQRGKSHEITDVNLAAIDGVFAQSGAALMIHGHTHRPAIHRHEIDGSVRTRYVLPDWECDTAIPRGGWLAMNEDGTVRRIDLGELQLPC